MPLINEHGQVIVDRWDCAVHDDDLTPVGAIVPLERLLADGPAETGPIGVLLPPDVHLDTLKPFLPRAAVIAIEFPKFRDGRGFSIARTLRDHYGYEGEIRAVGHMLPDQFRALIACGFTTVRVPDNQPVGRWAEELSPIGHERVSQLFGRLQQHAADKTVDPPPLLSRAQD